MAEGRDIGTTVFPHAELKIFLTASIDERAKRRKSDKNSKDSQEIDLHTLKELIKKRDFEDSNREISPLTKANDAIEIITDGYTCLLYTSPSPRDLSTSRMPSSA